MKDVVLTVALTDINDATVAAGIAVQSERLGPQDVPAVMSVYDRITGTDPDSHNYGLAQTNSDKMEKKSWDLRRMQSLGPRFSGRYNRGSHSKRTSRL